MNGHTSTKPRAAHDFYPTPVCATEALLRHVRFRGYAWEPASGDGHISKVLEQRGYKVKSSDLRPEGYGMGNIDFLTARSQVDNVITNPPYSLAEAFIRKAQVVARRKSAFLLQLAFLESEARYRLFTEFPPAKVIVLSKRLPFQIDGEWIKSGAVFGHCWIVWDREHQGPTTIEWDLTR